MEVLAVSNLNHSISMANLPVAPTPTSTPSTNLRVKYKIEFPPGSMGLELEPVIKSSEREIGCRVKDYYFAPDHEGIEPAFIQSRVNIGDIISSINGEDIKSWPFANIVDKLRELRDVNRVISFKNITASCKYILRLKKKIYPAIYISNLK